MLGGCHPSQLPGTWFPRPAHTPGRLIAHNHPVITYTKLVCIYVCVRFFLSSFLRDYFCCASKLVARWGGRVDRGTGNLLGNSRIWNAQQAQGFSRPSCDTTYILSWPSFLVWLHCRYFEVSPQHFPNYPNSWSRDQTKNPIGGTVAWVPTNFNRFHCWRPWIFSFVVQATFEVFHRS